MSSYAIDDGERLLLFDPLAVPVALLRLAREREPVIVLTAPWHERDAQALVERLQAAVFAPPPDTAQDLIDKYAVNAERAGDGSPDVKWLRSGGGNAHWYAAGDRLAIGIEAYAGRGRAEPPHFSEAREAPALSEQVRAVGRQRPCWW